MDKDEGTQFEIDNEYIMSAADLCTIDFIDKVIAAGVSVLKIEGRGRAADYVFTTTQCYREAIDAYYDGTFSAEKVADWKERLSTVFNRGFWDGYYLGRKMGEWSDEPGSKATKRKVYIGKGMKYYENAGIGEFLIEAQNVKVGDELITGPTTGVVELHLESLRVDDEPAEVAKRGATITFPVNEKIRPSDKLYKLVPVE
jgi:putative protease